MVSDMSRFSGDINAHGVPLSHKVAKVNKLKWIIMLLPLLFVVCTLIISMLQILKKSFIGSDGFTLEYYKKILTEPLYLKVLFNTLKTGVIVTAACLLLAYPAAYLSVRAKKPIVRRIITGGILIPYWISMLVRIFAWQIILQSNGVLNQLLMFLKITDEPIQFLYTTGAVCISMTHILLPYMFLSLQSNMEGIDENLTTAAGVMGARPARGFVDVFLPLSIPGVFSGCLMVFVLSLGFYIAPALLGGADNMMMSNLIEQNMNNFGSNLAAAMSFELLVIVFVIIGIAFKFVGNIFVNKK
jgi:putative spermidine/putrescine transport system permease protein/spermidine/putrescine transport system permease protein